MQPLVGTLHELIHRARNTPVRQFRGLVAPDGEKKKKTFAKSRGGKKQPPQAEATVSAPQAG